MLNKVTDLNMSSRDIVRTFCGGYIGYRDGDVIVPVRAIDSGSRNTIDFVLPSGAARSLPINDARLVLEHPDAGYSSYRGKLVYIYRRNSRQWHRCVLSRNLIVVDVYRGAHLPLELGSELLQPLYNQAPAQELDGCGGVAYGSKFAKDNTGNIYLHGKCVYNTTSWVSPEIETFFNRTLELAQ